MKDAESGTLRRKVASLGKSVGQVNNGVEYAVWRSLIENLRPPALTKTVKPPEKDGEDLLDSADVSKIGDLIPTEAAEVEIGEAAQLTTALADQAALAGGEQTMPVSLFPESGYECDPGLSAYPAASCHGGVDSPQLRSCTYYPGAVYSDGSLPILGYQTQPGDGFYISPMQTQYGHMFE